MIWIDKSVGVVLAAFRSNTSLVIFVFRLQRHSLSLCAHQLTSFGKLREKVNTLGQMSRKVVQNR